MQEDLGRKCPDVLKLGMLYETGIDVASIKGRPTYLSFQHKMLQEFAGSVFIQQSLHKSTDAKVIV